MAPWMLHGWCWLVRKRAPLEAGTGAPSTGRWRTQGGNVGAAGDAAVDRGCLGRRRPTGSNVPARTCRRRRGCWPSSKRLESSRRHRRPPGRDEPARPEAVRPRRPGTRKALEVDADEAGAPEPTKIARGARGERAGGVDLVGTGTPGCGLEGGPGAERSGARPPSRRCRHHRGSGRTIDAPANAAGKRRKNGLGSKNDPLDVTDVNGVCIGTMATLCATCRGRNSIPAARGRSPKRDRRAHPQRHAVVASC